jgi:diguanylate cyclase (GGDEF)-like protein
MGWSLRRDHANMEPHGRGRRRTPHGAWIEWLRSVTSIPQDELPDRRRFEVSETRESPPVRLLLVDDDPDYRAFVSVLARRLGFAVETAPDGEAALDRLAHGPFDVVVIDHQMPRLTGIGLIERIRALDDIKGIYALMLTSFDDVHTKVSALAAGFDDFVVKSSSEPELVAKLAAARRVAVRQRALHTTIRELYGLATRDELTNVFNRRFFVAEAERLLAAHTDVSLILFDLDDFKGVNDTFGHPAGDQVLRDVASLFQRTTRTEDLIARYGGDEFVMVVSGLPLADVERLATRLAAEVRELEWRIVEATFGITLTTGLASAHLLPRPSLEQLIEAADRDLYKNKWVRDHPEQQPELYEYPPGGSRADLVRPRP